ncbi:SDR family oxidoreductase, partial [Actinoplanes sp. NPDC089786]|uniref:SDR family oxidoreductase n=1 Tax=Actinoplanes sp. NPDC089786 TaxID=3155185 RepID=UPI0034384188
MDDLAHSVDKTAPKHLLLTGATGFIGQAVLERILSGYPDTRVTLVIRGRHGSSAQARLDRLLGLPVFDRWREGAGKEAVAEEIRNRVHTIDADLGHSALELPDDLTAVIHAASSVSFDPPVDEAFRSNVQAVAGLYGALLRSRAQPHVVHVSTAYVNGAKRGVVAERSLGHDLDWRAEMAVATAARGRAEQDSHRPAVLRGLLAEARKEHRGSGPGSVAAAAEKKRREWVDEQLVKQGRLRARVGGWTDVYTFTKAMGERVAEQMLSGELPLSVVRPAIVECALRHPYPGWIQGYKMADPLILAYGRGLITQFPGPADGIMDIIPVDLVVNALMAVATQPITVRPDPTVPRFYHVASGDRRPLTNLGMYQQVHRYFTANPMSKDGHGHVKATTFDFSGSARADGMLRMVSRAVDSAQQALLHGPRSTRSRRWQDLLSVTKTEVDALSRLSDLYGEYLQNEAVFRTENLIELHNHLPADRVAEHGFDPAELDWTDYFQHVYLPALAGNRRGAGRRPRAPRAPRPLTASVGNRTVAVFDLEGTIVSSNLIETYLMAKLNELP